MAEEKYHPLCPLKFACASSGAPPHTIDWMCEGEGCAWWSKGGERCAIVSIAMGFWAILDCIKDKQPSLSNTKKVRPKK